ncbi:MAG: hypothetical protein ACM3WV_00005 [Bacillota bacterium]
MKKTIMIALSILITLCACTAAYGAIHPQDYVFQSFTEPNLFVNVFIAEPVKWYNLGEPEKSIDIGAAVYVGDTFDDIQVYSVQYLESNMNFANAAFLSLPSGQITVIKGSYLFDFGLTLGADHFSQDSYSFTMLSAGYRLGFEKGFALISLDYGMDDYDSDIYGYELDAQYDLEQGRIFGEVYSIKDEDTYIMIGSLYPVRENLTLGAKYQTYDEYTGYEIGATWVQDALALNGTIGQTLFEDFFYKIGGTYAFSDSLSLGMDYGKNEYLDGGFAIRVKYTAGDFIVNFSLNMDYMPEIF